MYTTPESYFHSRDLFVNSLETIQTFYPQASLSSFFISEDDDLTIDWISAGSKDKKEKLFFLTTGIHGIEGFLGSIMIQLFINEFLPQFNPGTTGLLIVHCINPTGMSRKYRTNQFNVDLNRNFVKDFAVMMDSNSDYRLLDKFINPKNPIDSRWKTIPKFILNSARYFLKFGPERIREATLKGQYFDQSGVYFGGEEIQQETKCMMNLIDKWLPSYEKTIHLDMHTGYGPRSEMTLVQSPLEPIGSIDAKMKYSISNVAATNPEEFYSIQGEMSDYFYIKGKQHQKSIYSAAFEFGTYGNGIINEARSLLTSISANQLIQHGQHTDQGRWVLTDYEELFFPSDPHWLLRAIENGRQAFKGILKAEGYISEVSPRSD